MSILVSNDELVVVSFGNSPTWKHALRRLEKTISFHLPGANQLLLDEKWLRETSFYSTHKDFFLASRKGFGFWLWKPLAILDAFSKFPNAKIVIYLDAGCEINLNNLSKSRFDEYLEFTLKNHGLIFELDLLEKDFTCPSLLKFLGNHNPSQRQISASIIMLCNQKKNIEMVQKWLEISCLENFRYLRPNCDIDDNNHVCGNHRHDQSILSLLWRIFDLKTLPDETYWSPNWKKGRKFPLWTARNRLEISANSPRILLVLSRIKRAIFVRSFGLTSKFAACLQQWIIRFKS